MQPSNDPIFDRRETDDERWMATVIATRSQLDPTARRRFDDEHGEAIQSRSSDLSHAV